MIRQCCQCKRIWSDEQWIQPSVTQLEEQEISHGYCEECFVKQMKIIHNLNKLTHAKHKKVNHPFFF